VGNSSSVSPPTPFLPSGFPASPWSPYAFACLHGYQFALLVIFPRIDAFFFCFLMTPAAFQPEPFGIMTCHCLMFESTEVRFGIYPYTILRFFESLLPLFPVRPFFPTSPFLYFSRLERLYSVAVQSHKTCLYERIGFCPRSFLTNLSNFC